MYDIFQWASAPWLFGILSATLSLLAYLPYVIDTLRGSTQPQRASWFIWSVLGSVALASQVSSGASTSLWFVAVQVGGTVLIFVLSLWRGTGGLMRKCDCKVMAAALLGLGLWYLTDTPAYALAISITVSLLGGSVTVAKAYADPDSETAGFWAWSAVSAVFAILSVGAWDPLMLAYPAYILGLNIAILAAMALGRRERGTMSMANLRTVSAALEFSRAKPAP